MTAADAAPPNTDGPTVSILVISYDTRAMTLDCLASVVAETRVPHELIVLDNASPDGSAAAIAAAFPGIRLIASPENLGFARGNNVAAREARGEYVLLLNPDTLVLDRAIDRIVAFAGRTPQAGIWGGRTLHGDRTLNPGSVFGRVTLWSLFCRSTGLALIFRRSAFFNPEEMGAWDRGDERAVDVVQGSFFLIRRDLWERLGGFDATFVMYGEEQDLCLRARAAGARPRMTPEATIVHFHGASSRRAAREIMTLKARATMIRRHFPAWQRPLGLFLLGAWPWSRMVSGDLVARLSGRAHFAEAGRMWGDVWRARGEWREGYPPAA
ncbi:MAG TPA: glycosyltransferase family 2 protein [Amaricoccus sp.]|nr:glycosyltransferase family 2 protein [Amaricoccus sp.]